MSDTITKAEVETIINAQRSRPGMQVAAALGALQEDLDAYFEQKNSAPDNDIAFEALVAIQARISGWWDNPALVKFGSLSSSTVWDVDAIASQARAKLRRAQ